MKHLGDKMNWTYDDFKEAFYQLTGLDLSLYKERQMKRRIESLMLRTSIKSYESFIAKLSKDKDELNDFIDYITINVSEFFRNPEQWKILDREIIPLLWGKFDQLKIWCTACSTGEEPYSLAMILSKHLPLEEINIIATDIDNNVLEKAKIGEYSLDMLKNVSKDLLNRFFEIDGDQARVKDKLKKTITFSKHNLLKDPYPQGCHLILCRNVMIYFTEEAKEFLYLSFYRALHPEGILFVGSTEQIILPHLYNLRSRRPFFYERDNKDKQA